MSQAERIKARMEALNLSQSALARMIGVTQGTIAHLVSGRSTSSVHLPKIAKALQTTVEYLSLETDDPSEGYVPIPSTETVAGELGLVPVREIDLTFGMGATYLEVPVTTQVRHFSREWLRQYTSANPDHLFFAQGIGNSMEPYIHSQDLLLIDTSQQTIRMTDQIWAVAYGNCGAVRRLRPMADGSVKMLCDNPSVPDETAYDGELHVLGRVVAIVRKI